MGTRFRLMLTHIRLLLSGYPVWPSWTGWGITLDWPGPKAEKQTEWILEYLSSRFKESHFIHGPTFAAGGTVVVYLWPKSDPKARELLEPSDAPKDIPYR